jgi:hypothetical protein
MVFGANLYRAFAPMLADSTERSDVRDPWVDRMGQLPPTSAGPGSGGMCRSARL